MEINEATIPVVIVNFMLDDKDIDNIIHQMQLLPDENSGEYHKDNKSLVEKLSEHILDLQQIKNFISL